MPLSSRPGIRRMATFRGAAPGPWAEYRSQRRRPILRPRFLPRPDLWPDEGLFAAWLGHSTVLLKVDGFTILTDPVLGDRCGISVGNVTVGLKRLVAPALDASALPHIDLILLSHAHLDHFDTRTLRLLEHSKTTVITAANTSDLLRRRRRYREIREIGWDQETRLGPLHLRGFPVRHWGARMQTDVYRGYNGYLIEAGRRRIVFGGDTALTDSFRALKTSRPVDLAIMPIGAYNPWINAHCNPEQALQMTNDCGAEFVLPVHHQTFHLSREPYREPVERMLAAAGAHEDRVSLTEIGQEWKLR